MDNNATHTPAPTTATESAVITAWVYADAETQGRHLVDERILTAELRRSTGLGSATIADLYQRCRHERDTFELLVRPRWNADGEPIGPAVALAYDNALLVAAMAQRVSTALGGFFNELHEDPDRYTEERTIVRDEDGS